MIAKKQLCAYNIPLLSTVRTQPRSYSQEGLRDPLAIGLLEITPNTLGAASLCPPPASRNRSVTMKANELCYTNTDSIIWPG